MNKKTIYFVLGMLWMIVIFWFSSRIGDDSMSMSDGLITWFHGSMKLSFLQPGHPIYESIRFLVRKAAHMGEYAILAMLWFLFFKHAHSRRPLCYAMLIVIGYAVSDEFHQLFVPGRSGQLSDVGVDMFGGVIGLTFQQLCFHFRTSLLRKRY